MKKFLVNNFSRSLLKGDRFEIGRQLEGSVLLPLPLKIGVIIAVLNDSGSKPLSIKLSNNILSGTDNIGIVARTKR